MWGEDLRAYGGNLLHRSMIMSPPNVTWAGEQGLLYTMILFRTHSLRYLFPMRMHDRYITRTMVFWG